MSPKRKINCEVWQKSIVCMKVFLQRMATTVKISEETNRKLDRLQARLVLRTGRKLSKQEILEQLVRAGLTDETLIARRPSRIRYPIPDKAWKRILGKVTDLGIVTREEDIDTLLYGGEA